VELCLSGGKWKVETAIAKHSLSLPYRLLSLPHQTHITITTHTWPQQQQQQKQRKIRKRHGAHLSTAPHGLFFSPNSLFPHAIRNLNPSGGGGKNQKTKKNVSD